MKFYLLRRLLGVKTEGDGKAGKVTKLKKGEILMATCPLGLTWRSLSGEYWIYCSRWQGALITQVGEKCLERLRCSRKQS